MARDIHQEVQDYYSKELQQSSDLKTNACCTQVSYPSHIKKMLGQIHPEVLAKYYGCGLTIPQGVEGCRILDLGCGAGRDVYLAAQLTGPEGPVTGIDMTEEQLAVAERHLDYHRDKLGISNASFLKANIDHLEETQLPDEGFDLIISNCVINLCQNKQNVLAQCHRLLAPGGEMYFSDVYASRRVPEELRRDPVLYGECLSGALYWNDFLNYAKAAGFCDPRVVENSPITIENSELKQKCAGIDFYSITYRLFKLDLEPDCEDYGQSVCYRGSIPYVPESFTLDTHHHFERGRESRVCGNTFRMLHDSRYREHFNFTGDFSTHLGLFEGCGGKAPFEQIKESAKSSGGGCC